ncbi:hypothetical protein HEQ60_07170 [Haematospirillum sp. H1815]|uniref:hypothetical protein n=1 Tax=Haematospirillum sp. H1815 TaxID=2723108 RepID=UPI00143910ED|nr:hypothetical protein [Haematospirillum sp. H1815]NKD77539.1 hypothetical protein [Haematospirillum sp. H1815]
MSDFAAPSIQTQSNSPTSPERACVNRVGGVQITAQEDHNAGMERLDDDTLETSITEVATKASASDVVSIINAISKNEGIPEAAIGLIASQMEMELEPGEAIARANIELAKHVEEKEARYHALRFIKQGRKPFKHKKTRR